MNRIETNVASVIIPARNASATIARCLDALHAQDLPSRQLEIIVIDDGSADDTAAIARSRNVRVIDGGGRGAAAARNAGAAIASGDILLFTDSDCIPHATWAREMLSRFADPSVGGVKGVYDTRQRELTARFVQAEYEWKYERMSRFETIDFIDTYSAAFRTGVFHSAGGFDASFPAASVEDQELSFRLHARGVKMVFARNAVVTHRHASSWIRYLMKKFRIGYWKVRVLKRHPGKTLRDSHTPQLLKVQVAACIPLIGLSGASAVFFPFTLPAWILTWIAVSAPEIRTCFRSDGISLAICAPMFTFLRSLGLATGLFWGLLNGAHKG